jgi:hypothetical protein
MEQKRKARSDRKHRLTLRLPREDYNRIKVIAFNCNISINHVVELLLIAALESDHIIDKIYAAHPPGPHQFIYVHDEGDV